MDQIDYQIIGFLHENSQIPLAEMGRIIGMTQPAVKERVRRLEELVQFSERTGDFGNSYTLIVLTAPFEQKMMIGEEKII